MVMDDWFRLMDYVVKGEGFVGKFEFWKRKFVCCGEVRFVDLWFLELRWWKVGFWKGESEIGEVVENCFYCWFDKS